MSLLERIKILREQNGNISINKLEKEAGLTRGSMSKWDKHAPGYDKLKKVSDYFGVSVSDLTGEEQKKTPVLRKNEPEDEETIELREIWESSNQEDREFLIATARMLKARRKNNES